MCFGDGPRRLAHPRGTSPDASRAKLDHVRATADELQIVKVDHPSHLNSHHPSGRSVATDDELRWCGSLAGRLPLGSAEAMARVGCDVARLQQLGGLHKDDGNYHRRSVPEQCWRGQWMPQARGAAAMLITCAATCVDFIRSADSRLDDRGCVQAVVFVDQSGHRDTPRRWLTRAVLQAEGGGATVLVSY